MSVAWTLEYATEVRSLTSWGIRQPQLTFRNLDVDSFSFVIKRSDVLAAPAFANGAEIILRRNGVGWFRGTIRAEGAAGSRRSEFDSYTATNAWDSMLRTVYQQQWCINGVLEYTPRATLGQNVYGQKISVGRQIYEILTYALGKGVIVAPGAFPEGIECWRDEVRDLTCAGAIRSILKLLPNAIGWFDYSTGIPTFSVQASDALTAVTIDATAGDLVSDFNELQPRSDLVPPGVTFIYQSTNRHSEATGGDGRTYTVITRDIAGAVDAEGAIVALVELSENDTAPSGAAGVYFAALQIVQYQGTIRLMEDSCTGLLRPGKVLNISNGRAAWATMRAVVQTVTEDLVSGSTTVQLGPPEHLAPQDFVELQQIARRRAAPTLFPVVQMCVIPDPDADPGNPETGTPPAHTLPNPHAGIHPKALAAERADLGLPKTAAYVGQLGDGGYADVTLCPSGDPFRIRAVPSS